jgi:hypothetical protein
MRLVVAALAFVAFVSVVTLSGCAGHGEGGAIVCRHMGETHFPGDVFPAADGCNFCECITDGRIGTVSCSAEACTEDGGVVVDGGGGECAGDRVTGCDGPMCEGICCGQGERCESGRCSCNGGARCDNGDLCAPAGPQGPDACGVVCCGSTGPCPL